MDMLIGISDGISIEREIQNVYDVSWKPVWTKPLMIESQETVYFTKNSFRTLHDSSSRLCDDREINNENVDTLSLELNDRISTETGSFYGNVNIQIQRAVEEAICNQVLPQVQNVLRDGDASGPRDRERPEPSPDCLDSEKHGYEVKNS